MEEGKEDETNFLPLPEIRMLGMAKSVSFQVQGQTQYRQAEEKSEKKIGVGGKLMDWKLKRGQKVHGL